MRLPHRIKLDIDQEYYNLIPAQQGDTARVLNFQILNNNIPFSLENKTVRARIKKPDGNVCYNDMEIINASEGECDLKLTNQILIKPGMCKVQLEIMENGEILSTIIFAIFIRESIDIKDAAESTNEFTALENGIIKLDEWDKYFKETSGTIEEKYTERLNGIDSSLEEKVNKEQGKGLSTNDYTNTDKAEVAKVKDKLDKVKLLDLTYPVGSIYMSVNNTNPSSLFGGTWEEFAKGKTLIGVDTTQTEFNTVEKTGGEKTHKLIIDEMPIHTPKWNGYSAGILYTGSGSGVTYALFGSDAWRGSTSNGIQPVGGDKAHNNLQPYITCYMWKRTE